jgi:hypothetical protein
MELDNGPLAGMCASFIYSPFPLNLKYDIVNKIYKEVVVQYRHPFLSWRQIFFWLDKPDDKE